MMNSLESPEKQLAALRASHALNTSDTPKPVKAQQVMNLSGHKWVEFPMRP